MDKTICIVIYYFDFEVCHLKYNNSLKRNTI